MIHMESDRQDLHTVTNMREFLIDLSDEELHKIKHGRPVTLVYHPLWIKGGTLWVILGRRFPSKDAKWSWISRARSQGINVAPIALTRELLHQIEHGDSCPCFIFQGFSVVLASRRRLGA